jgi:uncharacterized protein YcbX
MERIGTVETICRYPVKSMAGEEVAQAFVGFAGLMGRPRGAHRQRGWNFEPKGLRSLKSIRAIWNVQYS